MDPRFNDRQTVSQPVHRDFSVMRIGFGLVGLGNWSKKYVEQILLLSKNKYLIDRSAAAAAKGRNTN